MEPSTRLSGSSKEKEKGAIADVMDKPMQIDFLLAGALTWANSRLFVTDDVSHYSTSISRSLSSYMYLAAREAEATNPIMFRNCLPKRHDRKLILFAL